MVIYKCRLLLAKNRLITKQLYWGKLAPNLMGMVHTKEKTECLLTPISRVDGNKLPIHTDQLVAIQYEEPIDTNQPVSTAIDRLLPPADPIGSTASVLVFACLQALSAIVLHSLTVEKKLDVLLL